MTESDAAQTVWLFEIVEPYASSYGVEAFSTLERAKAHRPDVDWQVYDDGVWYEPHRELSQHYTITPMRLDPEPDVPSISGSAAVS